MRKANASRLIRSERMNVQRKKVPQFVLPRGFAGRVTFKFMNRGQMNGGIS